MAANTAGTTLEVEVATVIDGDTFKVHFDEATTGESDLVNLRILGLDTEETHAGVGKPKTPWGEKAKEHAKGLVPEGSSITIEFPGTESIDECLRRYRGNYGRPLVYVHVDGEDYQEHMIRKGYSPYFTKYGYAVFDDHHRRYRDAEQNAQADDIGVWNQSKVNGSVMREYEPLRSWWTLRAEIVRRYRSATDDESILDTRQDYHRIENSVGDELTVFTELDGYERAGEKHAIVKIGSKEQPFQLFLPNALETEGGQRLISLMEKRYIAKSDGESVQRPNRSYAFVTGTVKQYPEEDGNPEIVVESIDQLADVPPETSDSDGK
ncbi:hypothetical protein A4G99_19855 [Haladaptatus sp. R4]|uniref:thermonuclease family protein n=1 Tax=Haladaptatus sp. R4 TaxID=1679489 RepID=UPI0007B4CE28|nr:thermonuclease family protein [Haladaptatus sp. R4]KZN22467.1 hypothetical protein A4G99_19855 [Haladaptatus sp. R4]